MPMGDDFFPDYILVVARTTCEEARSDPIVSKEECAKAIGKAFPRIRCLRVRRGVQVNGCTVHTERSDNKPAGCSVYGRQVGERTQVKATVVRKTGGGGCNKAEGMGYQCRVFCKARKDSVQGVNQQEAVNPFDVDYDD